MVEFKPFADDAAALTVGGMEVENGTGRIALHGSLDLTRDRAGLERARRLLGVLAEAVRVMEADPALPDAVAAAEGPVPTANPFA